MSEMRPTTEAPGWRAGRRLEEWNAAYAKVESYIRAMRVRNKMLLSQIVLQVLDRAMQRALAEPSRSATELAVEEMDLFIANWFAEVLQESPLDTPPWLSTKGRLALYLADMPSRWQDQFLRPAPWPAEFIRAMREVYLRAGPDFQLSQMAPRPLDLGPVTALTQLSRHPYARWLVLAIWTVFALLLVILFIRTH